MMTLEQNIVYDDFRTKILYMMTFSEYVYDDFQYEILYMMNLEPKYCL